MQDALSRIEAAATFLVEAKAGRALSADDMHEAVRRIRDWSQPSPAAGCAVRHEPDADTVPARAICDSPRCPTCGRLDAAGMTRQGWPPAGAVITAWTRDSIHYRGSMAAGGLGDYRGSVERISATVAGCRRYGRGWSTCLHRLPNCVPDRRCGRPSKRRPDSCRRGALRRPLGPMRATGASSAAGALPDPR
jgi:hypothetical protein